MTRTFIKAKLETLYKTRSMQNLANDPLSFCHRYENPLDREIAAVIASSFAYGSVATILRSLERIFSRMGNSPRKFVDTFDPPSGLKTFADFKHRFNDGRDLCALLWALRVMTSQCGTVEAFYMKGYHPTDDDIGASLNNYSTAVLSLDYSPVFRSSIIPESSYFPFLFPAPTSGSACKRLCMLLRWLVRPADGIDLGLWQEISPAQLIIPVDTHISRISRYLELTSRKTADWQMARDITYSLRAFDTDDPVRYDFPLAHLGISNLCTGSKRRHCSECPIKEICGHYRSK